MPFDGSGNFNRVMNWVNDSLANIKIKADRHDQEDDNFASGLSNVITKDGQTQPTNDIPLNGHRLVNVGVPTGATDAAIKSYVDAKLDFSTTGVPVPGSGAAASIRFADADIGFGTRHVDTPTPGLLNRFVWNDKPDLSGTDVAVLTEVGNFSVNGTFTTTGEIKGGLLTAASIVGIKPTSGNGHVWWYGTDGSTRMILYTSADAQGAGVLTVGGQAYTFGADGQFIAPVNVHAGAAWMDSGGNISGSIWDNWGAHDAYSAIGARIEARAAAFAGSYVSQLQYRKVSLGYNATSGGFSNLGAGTVIVGYNRLTGINGQVEGLYYMTLQVFDPVRGWVSFTG
jgi:hypothetical protein